MPHELYVFLNGLKLRISNVRCCAVNETCRDREQAIDSVERCHVDSPPKTGLQQLRANSPEPSASPAGRRFVAALVSCSSLAHHHLLRKYPSRSRCLALPMRQETPKKSSALITHTHAQSTKQISVIPRRDALLNSKVSGQLTQYLVNLAVHVLALAVRRTKPPHSGLGDRPIRHLVACRIAGRFSRPRRTRRRLLRQHRLGSLAIRGRPRNLRAEAAQ